MSNIDTVIRRTRRRLAALIVATTAAVAACGYDGPDMSSRMARDPAPAGTAVPGDTTVPPADDAPSGLAAAPLTTTTTPATTINPAPVPTVESLSPGPDVVERPASTDIAPASAPTTTTASSTTTVATTTTEPDRSAPRRVLVVGDSSAAGMRWTAGARDALQGADFTLDLESCRRLVERSCNGREGYTPSTALNALKSHAGGNYDTLIMATGYNDMDRNFTDAFDRIVAEARRQGIGTILWTTYREQVGYQLPSGASSAYAEMNDALAFRVLSGNYPELMLLDWWGYTQKATHWLTSDGVHFTRTGAFGMADLISRTLAAIDGRPCPAPWDLLTVRADPCPSPMDELERRGDVPPVLYLYDALR